jgi:hypothetical protein
MVPATGTGSQRPRLLRLRFVLVAVRLGAADSAIANLLAPLVCTTQSIGSCSGSASSRWGSARPAPQNRTSRLPRIPLERRPAQMRSTAAALRDGTSSGRERRSYLRWRVAVHHDV